MPRSDSMLTIGAAAPSRDGASGTVALRARLVASGVSLLFGGLFLFGVGFAHADLAHNAAHDTRHAFTFPCH